MTEERKYSIFSYTAHPTGKKTSAKLHLTEIIVSGDVQDISLTHHEGHQVFGVLMQRKRGRAVDRKTSQGR